MKKADSQPKIIVLVGDDHYRISTIFADYSWLLCSLEAALLGTVTVLNRYCF